MPHAGGVSRSLSFAMDGERGALELPVRTRRARLRRAFRPAPAGPRWQTAAARAAARLVFLLAGVSYYKTASAAGGRLR